MATAGGGRTRDLGFLSGECYFVHFLCPSLKAMKCQAWRREVSVGIGVHEIPLHDVGIPSATVTQKKAGET